MTDSLTLPTPFPVPADEHLLTGPGGVQRLLPAGGAVPVDLRAHLARYGALSDPGGPRRMIAEVEAAGLTGRGGAAFPVYRKLAAAADSAPAALVAGNGAEGEPASRKDASLLWIAPHLVLDGLQVAAWVAGSPAAVLYVRRSHRVGGAAGSGLAERGAAGPRPTLHQRLAQAIAERAALGMDAATVELRQAPDRFLAGEESALASRLAGRPARPAYRPVRGLPRMGSGQPVLVQNVETLAHLALIARYGAGWFRATGTGEEPGSMLATVHLPDGRRDVAEVPLGVPLAGLLGLRGGRKGRKFLLSLGTAGIIVALVCTGLLFRQTEKFRVDVNGAVQAMVRPDQSLSLEYNSRPPTSCSRGMEMRLQATVARPLRLALSIRLEIFVRPPKLCARTIWPQSPSKSSVIPPCPPIRWWRFSRIRSGTWMLREPRR